jgi:hypothetical protein
MKSIYFGIAALALLAVYLSPFAANFNTNKPEFA